MSQGNVPIWEKAALTIEEATAYSNIGRDRLYELTSDDDCGFALWVGKKRLIKRKKFDEFIDSTFSI